MGSTRGKGSAAVHAKTLRGTARVMNANSEVDCLAFERGGGLVIRRCALDQAL
jgi:hypothetical protein